MQLYLDGELAAEDTGLALQVRQPSPNLDIGRDSDASPDYAEALFDELFLYSRALSADEIAAAIERVRVGDVWTNAGGAPWVGWPDPTGTDGNISDYPKLDDNYHLIASSPCIDHGDSTCPVFETDIDGERRIMHHDAVDIGADEFFFFIAPDCDKDGDVDQADLRCLEACATGPDVPYNPEDLPTGCMPPSDGGETIAADFDEDGDVDQSDFGVFQRCYSGDGVWADPDCMD